MEQIKNRITDEIICGGLSLKTVIERHKKWINRKEGGERANLRSADLRGVDLRYANLSDADLRYADLRYADLRDANLIDANLRYADLSGANLGYTNFGYADLRQFKHDIWAVCAYAVQEVPALIDAIKTGKIDGSCYEGECCCLCGTLEKGLEAKLDIRDASSPAEQWFSMIKKGDTPETNQVSKLALEWVEEFYALVGGK